MIRLHSLTMNRFRGVREGTIEGFADVNLLIGRNNSGKTTIGEAVTRLFYGSCGSHVHDYLGRGVAAIWGAIRNETGDAPSELWYQLDRTQVVALEAKLVDSTRPGLDKPATIRFQMNVERNSFRATPSGVFLEGGVLQSEITPFIRAVSCYLPGDGKNRAIENKFWPDILANRRDKVLTQTLNQVFGFQAEGFQLLPDQRLMVLLEKHSVPVDVQGDGTRAALRALVVLMTLHGTLFIIEEPECHQHPGSLERFALALCHQARNQSVQLIVSTHSLECVRAFLKAAQEAKSEGAIFHLTLENGVQRARRLDAEAIETLQATGLDVRFLDLYG